MKALTVEPMRAGSAALEDVPEPSENMGSILVSAIALGVCGTDMEILSGQYGWPPPGRQRLIIGHESLGKVIEAPADAQVSPGDLVVGIVRRPDPVPCYSCARGEWDFCRNGEYTEHGIKSLDGYCAERFRLDPSFTVKVDNTLGVLGVLLEPTSIVAKAWEQIEKVGNRTYWEPHKVLITGAGPIGLLAALLATQRNMEVHVLDRVDGGRKPELVRKLGATYHQGTVKQALPDADVIIECTGASQVVLDAIENIGDGGVVCLTGVSSGGRKLVVDAGGLNKNMVLENEAVVGSVNANRRHYVAAAEALARADKEWLSGLISRKVSLDNWSDAFSRQENDVKVVIQIGEI